MGANLRDEQGATPLMWSAQQGLRDVVQFLLSTGADVNVSDRSGTTPLMFAALGRDEAIVGMLLHAGADARARNRQGHTALDLARQATAPRWTFQIPFSRRYFVVSLPPLFARHAVLRVLRTTA